MVWLLMLYDVSDLLFWCSRATGLGLTFRFLCLKKKTVEKLGKKCGSWARLCLVEVCTVHCCDLVRFFVLFFLFFWMLWRLLHFTLGVFDNHIPSLLPFGGVVYATSDKCTSVFISVHWFMSTIDSQVRQAGTLWADTVWNLESSDRKFWWINILSNSTEDPYCQNRNYSETCLWNTSHSSGYPSQPLKRVFESLFFYYYYFWQIL